MHSKQIVRTLATHFRMHHGVCTLKDKRFVSKSYDLPLTRFPLDFISTPSEVGRRFAPGQPSSYLLSSSPFSSVLFVSPLLSFRRVRVENSAHLRSSIYRAPGRTSHDRVFLSGVPTNSHDSILFLFPRSSFLVPRCRNRRDSETGEFACPIYWHEHKGSIKRSGIRRFHVSLDSQKWHSDVRPRVGMCYRTIWMS